MEYYSAIKKNEIMPFIATWMNLEIFMSEISQRKTNIIGHHLYMESNKNDRKKLIYKRETNSQISKQISLLP